MSFQFTTTASQLRATLGRVRLASDTRKSALDCLGWVRIHKHDTDSATFSCTDIEVILAEHIAVADCIGAGIACVPVKALVDALKGRTGTIALHADIGQGASTLRVSGGGGFNVAIPLEDSERFPEPPTFDPSAPV